MGYLHEFEYEEHDIDNKREVLRRAIQSRRVVIQMLTDRGLDMTGGFFGDAIKMKEDRLVEQMADLSFAIGKQILVYWSTDEKMKVEEARTFLVQMEEAGIRRGILILQHKMSPDVKKAMKNVLRQGYLIEIFYLNELLANYSHHFMVPKHTVLNDEEITELMKQYSVENPLQFPKMVVGDAIARYLGLKPGQVVRIDRGKLQNPDIPQPNTSYLTYRVIVFHKETAQEEE